MRTTSVRMLSAVIVIVLGFLNIGFLSLVSYRSIRSSLVGQRIELNRVLLETVVLRTEDRMTRAVRLIRHLTTSGELTGDVRSRTDRRLILQRHLDLLGEVDTLVFAGNDGSFVSTRSPDFPEPYRPVRRPWYQLQVPVYWTEPFLDYMDQRIMFAVSTPFIEDDGTVSGVIAALFDVASIATLLDSSDLQGGDFLALLSPSGRVIASRDNSLIGSDLFSPRIDALRAPERENESEVRIGSEAYRIGVRRLGGTGMYLVSGVNLAEIRDRLNREFVRVFVVQLALLLVFTGSAYLLIRRGIVPLEKLVDLMSQAELGDYTVRARLDQYEEIATLSRQFNKMLIGIQTRDEFLKHREMEIKNLAYYDSLTGLNNRTFLTRTLERILKDPSDGSADSSGALFYLDLDGFKTINDTMGHSTGDLVLQEVASRLSRNLRDRQLAARIGGDEFVLLLQDIDSVAVVRSVANRVIEALNRPFDVGRNSYEVGASIGIVLFPTHGRDAGTLLKKADLAMYKAKRNGKNTYQIFEENLEEEILVRNIMEVEIRRSVRDHLFHFVYQPQYELATGRIVGFEALLRTSNPDLTGFPIREIIGVAEETGMIDAIEKDVFARGFSFISQIRREFDSRLQLSVNVSSSHLMQSDFVGLFLESINRTGVDPAGINLEITESVMIKSMNTGREKLDVLRNRGVRIHLDDFGTGYSSLSYLQNLPIQCVKMDKSFIDSMENDAKNRKIIALMVEMAHSLGIHIVAEGLETASQHLMLKDLGFDIGQGFFFSPPITDAAVRALLRDPVNLMADSV